MTSPSVSIVLRCKDERPALERLFPLLAGQDFEGGVEILVVDSGSTDGTRLLELPGNARWIDLAPEEFTYGRALNLGCRRAGGEILVLLSAHCFPLDRGWLRALVAPFADPVIGATFGRQVGSVEVDPAEATRLHADYPSRGPSRMSFSNANGAIRATLFEKRPFDEGLQIGEEAPLVAHCGREGLAIRYVPEAAVRHAHPQDPVGLWRRAFWEGFVLEREHYRGARDYGPTRTLVRIGVSVARSFAFLVPRGRFLHSLRATLSETLRQLALREGGRSARGEGGGLLAGMSYGDLEAPPWVSSLRRFYPPPPPRLGWGGPFCLEPRPRNGGRPPFTRAEAEARVRRNLEHCSARLRAAFPDLRALFLAGGFGRGEGLCLSDPEGRPRPQNDYDLDLVLDRPPPRAILEELERELAGACGVPWVDLQVHRPRDLPLLARVTQYGRDLALGHRLLFHDGSPLPPFETGIPLPWLEGEKTLVARLWALLAARDLEDPLLRNAQAAKAALALLDARLIAGGLYRCRYAEKAAAYEELPASTLERSWIEWALARRLGDLDRPAPGPWSDLRDLYFETWLALESTRGGPCTLSSLPSRLRLCSRDDVRGRLVSLLRSGRRRKARLRVRAFLLFLSDRFEEAALSLRPLGFEGPPSREALRAFLLGPKASPLSLPGSPTPLAPLSPSS